MTICAVLGSPIAHSLSPVLHHAAYRHLGLDWEYRRHEMTEDRLAGFVAGLGPDWRGLSLTMPLKRIALTLGEVDPLARLAEAGNTLILGPDGRRVYNTDVDGLVDALQAAGVTGIGVATVLGSGATARSALISLARVGAGQVRMVARSPEKAAALEPLARRLGVGWEVVAWPGPDEADRAIGRPDLLVATTVAGAADPLAEAVAEAAAAVFDVIYHPWPTPLAAAAERRGRTVLNGLDLLVHQAVGQVRLMTGRQVPAGVLLAAGRAELARRAAVDQRFRP